MAKEKKTYCINVDYYYGPIETYYVDAYSLYEAKKKAKARYAREYFKKDYMKTYVNK